VSICITTDAHVKNDGHRERNRFVLLDNLERVSAVFDLNFDHILEVLMV